MKTWNVRRYLNGSSSTVETTVQAKTYADAKRLIEGQYGSSLKTISQLVEVR